MQNSGWLAGWRAAANPAQMGWKWSAGGKCMTRSNLMITLVVVAFATTCAGTSTLRRHSQLTPAFKEWLGSKGYLGATRGVTLSDDGRLIAAVDIAADGPIMNLPRHLVLSWMTIDPRRDASSALGRAIAEHPELFVSPCATLAPVT